MPTAEAKSLRAPTRGRLPWGKAVDYAMGWTRRIPEDFDGIVCVGEDEAERYAAKHPHVMYLPNGVDTKLFDGRETLGISRGWANTHWEGSAERHLLGVQTLLSW